MGGGVPRSVLTPHYFISYLADGVEGTITIFPDDMKLEKKITNTEFRGIGSKEKNRLKLQQGKL